MRKPHKMESKKKKELIEICKDLVEIKTVNPPGNEQKLVDYCQVFLKQIGAKIKVVQHSPTRSSLIAKWEGNIEGKQFLFVGHADTVPPGDIEKWRHNPFEPVVEGEKIFGRGASDMKSGIAALLLALRSLKEKKPENTIIFALTADEESGCLGAKSLLNMPDVLNPDFILIPEPTNNKIAIAEKGALWLRLMTYGKIAHASMPKMGVNAIENMITGLNNINLNQFKSQTHDLLGTFTDAITTFKSGIKINVIPDQCELQMDIRTLPGQDQQEIVNVINEQLKQVADIDPFFNFKTEIIIQRPGIESDSDQLFVRKIIEQIREVKQNVEYIGVNYFTDGAILIPHFKVPFIICGPGDPGQAHSVDEYVEINKLIDSYEIYDHLLEYLAFEKHLP
ncbi:MAG: M20 family metallopeptidase [Anaerolineaceae bacterium]|nr:M20 family metallopeptidase [Anaerolineaceae bacterium]